MNIRTTEDLRGFLEKKAWSCETLSSVVPVSNMTLRRLLERPAARELPKKYQVLLSALGEEVPKAVSTISMEPVNMVLTGMGKSKDNILQDLSHSGEHAEKKSIWSKTKKYARVLGAPKKLIEVIKELMKVFPKTGKKAQALILGGLIYFLNPFDLIADGILSVGLLDDLGVLLLIKSRLILTGAKPRK